MPNKNVNRKQTAVNRKMTNSVKMLTRQMSKANVGSRVGGLFGPQGALAGAIVDNMIRKRSDKRMARGQGAYGVNKARGPNVNSLFRDSSTLRPHMSSRDDETGRIKIRRREYLTRVVAPAADTPFEITSYSLNPGLAGVFPWGSQIAANFDEYEIRSYVLHYKPVISSATTSGAMGSILFACNYNAAAPPFETFREMVEYSGSMETRVCDEALFGVECDSKKSANAQTEYVRTGEVPADEDIKSYDFGLLQIATSDIASVFPEGTLLGHLYVEYEVVLGKPKLYASLGKGILIDKFWHNSGVVAFGPTSISSHGNSLGGSITYNNRYDFPANFEGTVLVVATVFQFGAFVPLPDTGLQLAGNVTFLKVSGKSGAATQQQAGIDSPDRSVMAYLQVRKQTGAVVNRFTWLDIKEAHTNGGTLVVTMLDPRAACAGLECDEL